MGRTEKGPKTDPGRSEDQDVSVYRNDIEILTSEYIDRYLDGDRALVRNTYRALFRYISNNINIDKDVLCLNDYLKLFDIYLELCDNYNINPTFGMYCKLYNINVNGIKSKLNNKDYYILYNYIYDICKYYTIDYLSNTKGNDRNMIFISSAVYGLSEIAPQKTNSQTIGLSNKELLENLKGTVPGIDSKLSE